MAQFRGILRLAKECDPDRVVIDAVDQANYGILLKAKRGLDYLVTFLRPRSRKHENWFRGLCRKLAEGKGWNADTTYDLLKAECGCFKRILISKQFGPVGILKSATEMSDYEYKALTDEAVEIIFRDILPGVERKAFIEEVEKMVGPRPK